MNTALSDIEVDYIDIDKPIKMTVPNHDGEYDFGLITSFAYKVKGTDREIVVATTRIETMLGDTAVAVHSKDPRYKDLVGKELVHPFCPNRKIKVITDDVLVQMEFGTGAVKITPGHDPNDFESGVRNKL
jgi:valyl-tRNA synthetase